MIKINLLPEEFHARKRKIRFAPRWGFWGAGILVFFLVLALLTVWQRSQLGRLEKEIRQTRIEAEKHKADLELVRELTALKERILQRMRVVEELNQNRTRWIEIFSALSAAMPEDMWLVSFKELRTAEGPQAQIHGMSFSLKPIARLMDRVEETKWFSYPRFSYARRVPVPEGMAYDFELMADLFSYAKVSYGGSSLSAEEVDQEKDE
ncbi:PilN domain-containing protein [Candidatus Zixiibacteriota bacterium]